MKKLIYLFIAATVLFSSCKKTEDIEKLVMVLEGIVIDNVTKEAIADVTVTLKSNGKTSTATTDEDGYFTLGSKPLGEYGVLLEKEGYLSTKATFGSHSCCIDNDNLYLISSFGEIEMAQLQPSFYLTAYKSYQSGFDIAAGGVDITLNLGYGNEPITVTTDANGTVVVDSLPKGSNIWYTMDFNEGGSWFYGQDYFSTNGVIANRTVWAYEQMGQFSLAVVSANVLEDGEEVLDFNTSEDVTIKFNAPIDTSTAYVGLSLDYSPADFIDWEYPVYEETWSADLTTVTVEIFGTLMSESEYSVSFYVESENDDLGETYNFETE